MLTQFLVNKEEPEEYTVLLKERDRAALQRKGCRPSGLGFSMAMLTIHSLTRAHPRLHCKSLL